MRVWVYISVNIKNGERNITKKMGLQNCENEMGLGIMKCEVWRGHSTVRGEENMTCEVKARDSCEVM